MKCAQTTTDYRCMAVSDLTHEIQKDTYKNRDTLKKKFNTGVKEETLSVEEILDLLTNQRNKYKSTKTKTQTS